MGSQRQRVGRSKLGLKEIVASSFLAAPAPHAPVACVYERVMYVSSECAAGVVQAPGLEN